MVTDERARPTKYDVAALAASVLSSAVPIDPPTCCAVLTSPDASPASRGVVPVTGKAFQPLSLNRSAAYAVGADIGHSHVRVALYDLHGTPVWDQAEDLLALLDHLGIDSVVLGGMSHGGYITMRVPLLAPDRVRAMILLDDIVQVAARADLD